MRPLARAHRMVLREYAARWRALRAWGRELGEVEVAVTGPRADRFGRCWPGERRVQVHARGEDLADDLATLLHELAHAAAPDRDRHGPRWRALLAAAVREVTGAACDAGLPQEVLDARVRDAIAAWLRGGQ